MITFTRNPASAPRSAQQRQEILANPGFGRHFTDHMVSIEYDRDRGWHDAQVMPYGPVTLDPATNFIHYGQAIFEGMKAYRHADGSVWLFRPERNAQRMIGSAHRLALPGLPEELFLRACEALVKVDQRFVPDNEGEKSLYLRPFMFASEAFLGVRPGKHVTFMVIASPAGAYFAQGVKPVSLWLSTDYTRAGRGGMGAAKTGGNYASSLIAQQQAQAQGCDQVVFLDAQEGRYVEELGGMNLYFLYADGRIATPATGTILEGITRDSIIALARQRGHAVEERRIDIQEWKDGVTSGEIVEVFACGTAAVVTPVGQLKWDGGETPAVTEPGETTLAIRKSLVDVQYGRANDDFGWMHRVC